LTIVTSTTPCAWRWLASSMASQSSEAQWAQRWHCCWAAVTLGLVCLILIAADAAEREHRKW
jgi:hypothetical protein